MTDALALTALVDAARRGDEAARVRLVDTWLPVVLRWCATLGGPLVDAEDAAHDVLLLALTRLERLREPESFPAWLFGITRRVLADHRRSRWIRSWIPGPLAELVDGGEGPVRRRERSELAERVQGAIDRVPAELREVLVLCDVEERDGAEVAALLGVPLGTVKSRLARARVRFARAARAAGLAPDAPDTPDARDGDEEAP